jgi:TRAP-type transport system periplasmic protein
MLFRRGLLKTAGSAALSAAVGGLGLSVSLAVRAAGSSPRTLTLGHQFAPGSLPDRVAERLASQLRERSGGRIEVQLIPGAALGDELQHLKLLRSGSLDLSVTGDLIVSSLSEEYLVFNLPFLYRDTAHALAAYASPAGLRMREEMKAGGLRALSWHPVGVRMLTAQRPIARVQDMQGLRLRLPADVAWTAVWRMLGAQPVRVAFTDLPAALRLGRVEAQENPPNFIRAGQLHQYQSHLMTTAHMPQRQFVFASGPRWAQWAPREREWVLEAAREASGWAVLMAEQEHQRDMAWLLGQGGMQHVTFDTTGISEQLEPIAVGLAGEAGRSLYRQIRQLG